MTPTLPTLFTQRGCRGFTLLELLIALSISGLLLALLSEVFQDIGIAGRGILSASDTAEREAEAERLFRQLISNIEPSSRANGAPSLIGAPTELTVVTSPPGAMASLGPVKARLYESTDSERRDVTAQLDVYAIAASERSPRRAVASAKLLRDGRTIRFRYGVFSTGKLEFQDHWSRHDRLPDLVEMTISSREKGAETITAIERPRRIAAFGCKATPSWTSC